MWNLLLLQLHQQCEDRSVLRYVYYYLARVLSDGGCQSLSQGGGIPTPNWDALADIDAIGGVTRADVVPRIVEQLTLEASNADVESMLDPLFNLYLFIVLVDYLSVLFFGYIFVNFQLFYIGSIYNS